MDDVVVLSSIAEHINENKIKKQRISNNISTITSKINGTSILHCIVISSSIRVIELIGTLIQIGANVNTRNQYNETPLHLAASSKDLYVPTKVMRVLLDNNADINAQDSWGWTPLHIAVVKQIVPSVEFLLENGSNMNLKTTNIKNIYFTTTQNIYAAKLTALDIATINRNWPKMHSPANDQIINLLSNKVLKTLDINRIQSTMNFTCVKFTITSLVSIKRH